MSITFRRLTLVLGMVTTVLPSAKLPASLKAAWTPPPDKPLKTTLDDLGLAIISVGGGAAGPLWGTLIQGLALPVSEETDEIDGTLLKAMLASALEEVKVITPARIGDKTMMDALIPAVEAAQAAGNSTREVLDAAAAAAGQGARDTENYVSRYGRAKNYKERTSNLVVNKKLDEAERVTIVTLGGAGHEPALSGFVGEGMVDISVVGDIFAAPGPPATLEAIRMADKGQGVLFVVLNHAGDMLTGNMTMKTAGREGLNVKKLVTQEDIANAPREQADDRRGLVGCVPTYKIAGAAAAQGKSLDEVYALAERFHDA